jgi:hypothetical protein
MSDMPWSTALCFLLAGVVLFCILFLVYDAWKHREPKRRKIRIERSPYTVGRDCYRDVPGIHK